MKGNQRQKNNGDQPLLPLRFGVTSAARLSILTGRRHRKSLTWICRNIAKPERAQPLEKTDHDFTAGILARDGRGGIGRHGGGGQSLGGA